MKDDKGLYYYPFPENKQVRMYVKEEDGQVWFRLWNQKDATLWDDHGWWPWAAVKKAIEIYDGKGFDPKKAYDLHVAKMILKDGTPH